MSARTGRPPRLAVPDDFPEMARTLPTRAIARRCGVSQDTVRRWRERYGIPPLTPGVGRGALEFGGMDSPEQIAACLRCTRADCSGDCPRRRNNRKKAELKC